MKREERFLRSTVRGLSPSYRGAAMEELKSHLYERRAQLISEGKTEEEASAQALAELGPHTEIRRGLRQADPVPPALTVLAFAGLIAVLMSPLFILGPATFHSAYLGNRGVQPADYSRESLIGVGYVPFSTLRSEWAGSGVQLVKADHNYALQASGLTPVNLQATSLQAECGPVMPNDSGFPLSQRGIEQAALVEPNDLLGCAAAAGWPLEVTPEAVNLEGHGALWKLPEDGPERQSALWAVYMPSVTRALLPFEELRDALKLPALQGEGHKETAHYALPAPADKPALVLTKGQMQGAAGRPETLLVSQFVEPNSAGEIEVPLYLYNAVQATKVVDDLDQWLNAPADQPTAIIVPLSRNAQAELSLQPLAITQR